MKWVVATALCFTGLAVWTAFRQPVVSPGYGAMALGSILRLGAYRQSGRRALEYMTVYMAVWLVGLCYLLSLLAGRPNHLAFWAVFGAANAVLLPSAVLFWRLIVRARPSHADGVSR